MERTRHSVSLLDMLQAVFDMARHSVVAPVIVGTRYGVSEILRMTLGASRASCPAVICQRMLRSTVEFDRTLLSQLVDFVADEEFDDGGIEAAVAGFGAEDGTGLFAAE